MAGFWDYLFGRKKSQQTDDGDLQLRVERAGWHYVSSSNVEAVRHVGGLQLQVMFLAKGRWSRSIYAYYGADESVFYSMMASASKGKFVWRSLRGVYPYARLS